MRCLISERQPARWYRGACRIGRDRIVAGQELLAGCSSCVLMNEVEAKWILFRNAAKWFDRSWCVLYNLNLNKLQLNNLKYVFLEYFNIGRLVSETGPWIIIETAQRL